MASILPNRYIEPNFRLNAPEGTQWKTLDTIVPRLGAKRPEVVEQLNKEHGELNWRFAWQIDEGKFVGFKDAVQLYESSYLEHLRMSPEKAEYLSKNASDVFDTTPNNSVSGDNYYLQATPAAHIQDIAIRRAMAKLGMEFKGNAPIKVRSRYNKDSVGISLSPKKVDFYKPEIVKAKRKANAPATVEDFWQYNRVIQFCDDLAKLPLSEKKKLVDSPIHFPEFIHES
jgi:hypothetical protein